MCKSGVSPVHAESPGSSTASKWPKNCICTQNIWQSWNVLHRWIILVNYTCQKYNNYTLSDFPQHLGKCFWLWLLWRLRPAGLLWNLSSADELKAELRDTALPALTENVVVPFTCWSDKSANNNIHPDVFHNATGCLRWEHPHCSQEPPAVIKRKQDCLRQSLSITLAVPLGWIKRQVATRNQYSCLSCFKSV